MIPFVVLHVLGLFMLYPSLSKDASEPIRHVAFDPIPLMRFPCPKNLPSFSFAIRLMVNRLGIALFWQDKKASGSQATRKMLGLGLLLGGLWMVGWVQTNSARADFTMYRLPGTQLGILLSGRAIYNPGGTITFKHPRGTLYFNVRDVEILKSDSPEKIYAQKLRQVRKSGEVDQFLELSLWALENGMLDKCKELLGEAWKINPSHKRLRRLAGLMPYLRRPVPDAPELEKKTRTFVGGRSMQSTRSRHFLLLHDEDTAKDQATGKTRAQMRLDLLEKVYESYFLAFAFRGKFLRPPKEPLQVVFFSDHADFMQLERRLEMRLRRVAGFYVPEQNISVFYDSGTTDVFKQLQQMNADLAEIKQRLKRQRLPGGGDIIRMANTLELLTDIERESEDVSTVSHEAVHHLAANTGLFPRDSMFIRWVHEGLASYFESAKQAQWSGVGIVDQDRIGYYRVLERDPERGSLEFIVSDLGFLVEASLGDQLPAYGQAWALTHYLFNERFDELMTFYERVGKLEQVEIEDVEDFEARGEKLKQIFEECFGDQNSLELEWRRYMRSLRTDVEKLVQASNN